MEDNQVFELMDMYASTEPRATKVGEVVYSPKEVQALVDWMRGTTREHERDFGTPNARIFQDLARRHAKGMKSWEIRRAMDAWGLGRPPSRGRP
jgi:hypothetical protein